MQTFGKKNNGPEAFLLRLGKLPVGKLTYSEGNWVFEYSEEFRRSPAARPLLEFPDLNAQYTSPYLWAFFALRIPSLSNPQIVDILRSEKISSDDKPRLLSHFGRLTATNPFELIPS